MSPIFQLIRKLVLLIQLLVVIGLLVACSANTTNRVAQPTEFNAKGCNNVAILLPATKEAERWENLDRSLLEQEIIKELPGVTLRYFNANGDAKLQEKQAKIALEKKACILVISPVEGEIVKKVKLEEEKLEKLKKVPVIAYDRFIEDDGLAFYVSFDAQKVGEFQADYIIEEFNKKDGGTYKLQTGANLVMINGANSDNNAHLIQQGWFKKLQPLINEKKLNLVFPKNSEDVSNYLDWDAKKAQAKIKELLNQFQNNIQIILVANDEMAKAIIEVLGELKGKVLVTGQDGHSKSTAENIVQGYQAMTVYKPIPQIAEATAKLVVALSKGNDTTSKINRSTQTKNGKKIPSFLAKPSTVDQRNIKDTLVHDGIVTIEELCKYAPKKAGEDCRYQRTSQ